MKSRLFIFLTCLFLSSCSFHDRSDDNLRISLQTEPPTLDWNLATDNVSLAVLNQLMEGLTQYDENLNPIPAIASSWDVKDGGKTYIFHLDPAYRWSDGKPVTAADFRYSWLRLLRPETAAPYAYFLFDIQGAQEFNKGQFRDESQVGIKVLDALTLEVRLKNPVVYFPSITTFMVTFPLRADGVEQFGTRWTEPQNLKTCGPYTLKLWQHEYKLELEKNPYYGGAPKPSVPHLTFFVVPDPSTAHSLYENDLLDVVPLPPMALPFHENDPEKVSSSKLRGYYYGFNILKAPFNDKRVRQALAYALDKSSLPLILKGGEIPTDSWIPQGMFGARENIGLHFDLQKAKKLLDEAGYGSLRPFPQTTLTFNSDPQNRKIAEWAQGQWKKNLGITIGLDNQEWKSYLSLLDNDPPGLFRMGWGADYPDPDNFMNLFTIQSGNNYTEWKNPRYDALIAQGAVERKSEKRQALYDQAQKILLEEDTVIIPLFITSQNLLVKKKWHPFPLNPMDFLYYKKVQPHPMNQ